MLMFSFCSQLLELYCCDVQVRTCLPPLGQRTNNIVRCSSCCVFRIVSCLIFVPRHTKPHHAAFCYVLMMCSTFHTFALGSPSIVATVLERTCMCACDSRLRAVTSFSHGTSLAFVIILQFGKSISFGLATRLRMSPSCLNGYTAEGHC